MLVALYLAAIVAANLSVAAFGPGVTIVNAFALIGLDLSTRDALHDRWRGRWLLARMALLIASVGRSATPSTPRLDQSPSPRRSPSRSAQPSTERPTSCSSHTGGWSG
jgi:hypothetical protein